MDTSPKRKRIIPRGQRANREKADANHAKRLQAYQMRLAGLSYPEIGRQLGVSGERVRQWFQKYAAKLERETLAEYRGLELDRLDKLQTAIDSVVNLAMSMVHNEEPYCEHCGRGARPAPVLLMKMMDQVTKASAGQVRIQESRRVLLGLNAAEKHHHVIEERTQQEMDLDKVLREANERVRAEESAMKEQPAPEPEEF